MRTRLLLSYLLVIGVGAAALALTTWLLGPPLFHQQLGPAAGRGYGARLGALDTAAIDRDFSSALTVSLLVALGLSLVTAGVAAVLVSRRILRPLDAVRAATRRLAAGHYHEPVQPPDEVELAALAADVNVLGAALAGSEARRAQLLSEVTHELRTPLTTIEGHVEGLMDGVFSAPEVYAAVTAETSRMRRLVADLSLLSHADEGSLEMRPARADLGDLAGDVARRLRPQFDGKGVGLRVEPSPRLAVLVDPDRITQVLTNLVGNALTYTPAHGQVVLTCGRRGRWAEVAVRDSGRGLAAHDVERVFERFYRVRDGAAHPGGGTGVGLTIARSIARASGGDVVAVSPGLGRGATFTLRLPLAAHTRAQPFPLEEAPVSPAA